MITAYLIYEGQSPSIYHARYLDEEMCKAEVNRLESLRLAHNKEVTERPATGRGSAFLNMLRNDPWTYRKVEFPE
jgi:hypothetical protein